MLRIVALLCTLIAADRALGQPYELYVANTRAGTVSVIETASHRHVAEIPVGFRPEDLAFSPADGYVYVANQASGTLSVIDPDLRSVVSTVHIGQRPSRVLASPTRHEVYVARQFSESPDGNKLVIFATDRQAIVDVVPLLGEPGGLALDRTGDRLFVVYDDIPFLSVVSLVSRAVEDSVRVGPFPTDVALCCEDRIAVVAHFGTNEIYTISTDSLDVIDRIETRGGYRVGSHAGSTMALLSDLGGGGVTVVDADAGESVGRIAFGSGPLDFAITPDGKSAYVTDPTENTVYGIDLASSRVFAGPISVGESPQGIALVPASPPPAPAANGCGLIPPPRCSPAAPSIGFVLLFLLAMATLRWRNRS
jgi:YVTN family beta-propeller protein